MTFAPVERALRLAGGLATAFSIGTVVQGVRRSSQHEIGKQGDRILTALHHPYTLAGASVAGIAFLVGTWRPLPIRLPRTVETAMTLAGSVLFFSGIGLFHWGRRAMGAMYDVSTGTSVQLYADHRLITSGPFAYVRHPLYVAGTLAEVGALLMYRTWATAIIALNIASLIMRSRREEGALAQEFGEEWARYAARVPGWVPRFGTPTSSTEAKIGEQIPY